MKKLRLASCLRIVVLVIAVPMMPAVAASNPQPTCFVTSKLGSDFQEAERLLGTAEWKAAAKKFESVLTTFEAPAAALYAAYSYAKLADFQSARPLIERAKSGRVCLTVNENSQLSWLIDMYNNSTTIPKIYGRSGGTLSAGRDSNTLEPRAIERQYAEALKACDRDSSIDSVIPSLRENAKKTKTKCLAQAEENYKKLRFEYRDPCGLLIEKPGQYGEALACVKRYRGREHGIYDPLTSEMPKLP